MHEGTLLLEKADGIALITINNPAVMNALTVASYQLLEQMLDGLEQVVVDPQLVVDAIGAPDLAGCIKAACPEVGAYFAGVALLHEAVVVLMEGPATRQVR